MEEGQAVKMCSYCGGPVAIREGDIGYVHTTTGNRIVNISPGDFVSYRHNFRGTPVGAYDVVNGDPRGYMILTARVTRPFELGPEPYRLPGRRGAWSLRFVGGS